MKSGFPTGDLNDIQRVDDFQDQGPITMTEEHLGPATGETMIAIPADLEGENILDVGGVPGPDPGDSPATMAAALTNKVLDDLWSLAPFEGPPEEHVYFRVTRIKARNFRICRDFVAQGRDLIILRDTKIQVGGEFDEKALWEFYGTDAHSFTEFGEKELGYKHSMLFGMIGVAEQMGEILERNPELFETDYSRFIRLLPVIREITDEEEKIDWIRTAVNSQSVRDLENTIKESRGGAATDACDHMRTTRMLRCDRCGKMWKEGNKPE